MNKEQKTIEERMHIIEVKFKDTDAKIAEIEYSFDQCKDNVDDHENRIDSMEVDIGNVQEGKADADAFDDVVTGDNFEEHLDNNEVTPVFIKKMIDEQCTLWSSKMAKYIVWGAAILASIDIITFIYTLIK